MKLNKLKIFIMHFSNVYHLIIYIQKLLNLVLPFLFYILKFRLVFLTNIILIIVLLTILNNTISFEIKLWNLLCPMCIIWFEGLIKILIYILMFIYCRWSSQMNGLIVKLIINYLWGASFFLNLTRYKLWLNLTYL